MGSNGQWFCSSLLAIEALLGMIISEIYYHLPNLQQLPLFIPGLLFLHVLLRTLYKLEWRQWGSPKESGMFIEL